jgi:hypothetical protein
VSLSDVARQALHDRCPRGRFDEPPLRTNVLAFCP